MQEFGFTDLLALGRALDSAARVEALRLLSQEGSLSAGELAQKLGLTPGAMTGHIRRLQEAGLVDVENANGAHGVRRMVRLRQKRLALNLEAARRRSAATRWSCRWAPTRRTACCRPAAWPRRRGGSGRWTTRAPSTTRAIFRRGCSGCWRGMSSTASPTASRGAAG